MRWIKKLALGAISLLLFSNTALAIGLNSNIGVQTYTTLEGSVNIVPIDATYESGSTSTRWAKMWTVDLDVSGVFTFGGAMGSNLDMDGYNLILDTDGDTAIINDRDAGVADDEFDIQVASAVDWTFSADTLTAVDGSSFVVEDGQVTVQVDDNTNKIALDLDNDDVTNNPSTLRLANAGTGLDLDKVAGIWKWGGSGATNNEDLIWDYETVADTIGLSSTTGVTTIDTGVISLSVPSILLGDDEVLYQGAGNDTGRLYETADANALALLSYIDKTKDANNVPVFVYGDETALNLDLGLFNGITTPTVAVLSDDATKAFKSSHDGTNSILNSTSGNIKLTSLLEANAGLDITNSSTTLSFGTGTYGQFRASADDGLKIHLGTSGNANNNLILTAATSASKDHDHSGMSTNPTIFIHSVTDPDVDNTQWGSLAYIAATDSFDIVTGGGEVKIGSTEPGHITPTTGDLMVSGELEVDGQVFLDSTLSLYSALVRDAGFSLNHTGNSENVLGLYSNDPLVIGDYTYRNSNFDHGSQSDPTIFIQSATDPDTDNTEYMGITVASATGGAISMGSSGTEDQDGHDLTIISGDAGSGGTGNHNGGNLILNTGALQGTGAKGEFRVGVNGSDGVKTIFGNSSTAAGSNYVVMDGTGANMSIDTYDGNTGSHLSEIFTGSSSMLFSTMSGSNRDLIFRAVDVAETIDFRVGTTSKLIVENYESNFTPETITSSGTDDHGISIEQTLNDSGAAGGSDLYNALKVITTETDTTGWDQKHLFDFSSIGSVSTPTTTAFRDFAGFVTQSDNAIGGVQLQNTSTGTSAEMRFVASSNASGEYIAFTAPSSTNTGTFMGITKGDGHFIFSTARHLGIFTLNSGDNVIFGTENIERMRLTNKALDVTPGSYVSGGTDDHGISIAQTLNDSGAAGGSDVYRGLEVDLTTTDVTGWDEVYLLDLIDDTVSKFNVQLDGDVNMTGSLVGVTSTLTGTQNTALTFSIPDQGANTNAGVGITIEADDGGTGTTGGAGGDVTINAGDAQGTGDNAGGDVIVDLGQNANMAARGQLTVSYGGTPIGALIAGGAAADEIGLVGDVADSVSAVAINMGATNDLTTAGAKLVSFRDNISNAGGSELAYIDYLGAGVFTGLSDGTFSVSSGAFTGVASLGLGGDITTTGAAIDWDLIDNTADAISFDATGKAGIFAIRTVDNQEGISTSGGLSVGTNTNFTPSSDTAQANDSAVNCNANTIARVVGDGGATVLDADPAISDGASDGQVCIIQGTSDTNTVEIADAVNTALAGDAAVTLGQGDILQVVWDSGDSLWYEMSRSNN